MSYWYEGKVKRFIEVKFHKYSQKKKSNQMSSKVTNIAKYTLSDLEEEEEDKSLNEN